MIKAIMAVDEEFGIGKDGTLPWPANKEDLKYFKNKTSGHIVVMGSKTWSDPCFPGPLPNRENYVITSKTSGFDGAILLGSNYKQELINIAKNTNKIVWIIGGPSIVENCWDIIEEVYLTRIEGNHNCDTFLDFPKDKFVLEIYEKDSNKNIYEMYRSKG